jgi:hypothetical protein
METTYNSAASVGNSDGILVADPTYSADPNVLERNFTRDTLSPISHIVGRMLAKMEFTTELRGNGKQNSGVLTDAPIIARLFRACGYKLTACPDPGAIGPFNIGDIANPIAWSLGSGAFATGTLTISTGVPAANDTVTIGSRTYTWKSALTGAANEVLIGGTITASGDNLAAAINRGPGEGTVYGANTLINDDVAASNSSGAVTVTAKLAGDSANSIATTESGTNTAWGAATLAGGTDVATTSDMIAYYLEVTTGGASGTAEITVTSDTAGEGVAAAAVTSGSVFTIGTKGLTLTPAFTGNLTQGDKYVVWLAPAGLKLLPISDFFESITLVMHKDRVKHTMPGAFGTFEVTAEAGNYASIKWTFTGTYQAPVDAASLPSPVFEKTLPSQVELARLRLTDFNAVVQKFTFNQGNDIQIRPDVSSSQGYIGTRIVGRKPEGGVNPEADLVANYDFWGMLRNATRMPFQMRVGTAAGNTVWCLAPSTQYSGMTYQDRQGISAYDAGMKFSAYQADDEMCFFMC